MTVTAFKHHFFILNRRDGLDSFKGVMKTSGQMDVDSVDSRRPMSTRKTSVVDVDQLKR